MKKYKSKFKWNRSKFDKYTFGILIAIELLMSFTFLGYIHVPPISVTIAYIPTIVAGCLFGPLESTIAGLVFGLGSMYKASAFYVMPADMIFSPFRSELPLESVILSVGTRMLFGFIIGILFALVKRSKHIALWNGIIAVAAPRINAIFVYTAMGIFFPQMGYNVSSSLLFSWNDLVIAAICLIFVEIIPVFYKSDSLRNFKESVDKSEKNPYSSGRISVALFVVGTFVVCMAVFSTIYFTQRAGYMLDQHGVKVSEVILSDLMHLQIQFLIAVLALNYILILMVVIVYRYMLYKEYKGEMDHLTGVMGRRLFLRHCEIIQSECTAASMDEVNEAAKGWFLFIDIDHFKRINDTLGHTVGDETLKKVAMVLKDVFYGFGSVGRVGGDEFAVIVEKKMQKDKLEEKLEKFLSDISGILPQTKVSCSIGAQRFIVPQEMKGLLTAADNILYKAKENGRACYVIDEDTAKLNS